MALRTKNARKASLLRFSQRGAATLYVLFIASMIGISSVGYLSTVGGSVRMATKNQVNSKLEFTADALLGLASHQLDQVLEKSAQNTGGQGDWLDVYSAENAILGTINELGNYQGVQIGNGIEVGLTLGDLPEGSYNPSLLSSSQVEELAQAQGISSGNQVEVGHKALLKATARIGNNEIALTREVGHDHLYDYEGKFFGLPLSGNVVFVLDRSWDMAWGVSHHIRHNKRPTNFISPVWGDTGEDWVDEATELPQSQTKKRAVESEFIDTLAVNRDIERVGVVHYGYNVSLAASMIMNQSIMTHLDSTPGWYVGQGHPVWTNRELYQRAAYHSTTGYESLDDGLGGGGVGKTFATLTKAYMSHALKMAMDSFGNSNQNVDWLVLVSDGMADGTLPDETNTYSYTQNVPLRSGPQNLTSATKIHYAHPQGTSFSGDTPAERDLSRINWFSQRFQALQQSNSRWENTKFATIFMSGPLGNTPLMQGLADSVGGYYSDPLAGTVVEYAPEDDE